MMSKRPIYLFVTPFFPSPSTWRGGYCYDMVRALMRTGRYDIRVISPGNGETYVYAGVNVHTYRHLELPSGVLPFACAYINQRRFVAAISQAGINFSHVAVCHVHTVGLGAVVLAAKYANPKIRTLLHHHCLNPIRLSSGRLGVVPVHATLLYRYYQRVCEKTDLHVFCSRESKSSFGMAWIENIPERGYLDVRKKLWLGRWLGNLRCRQAYVYYNGYDPEVFSMEPSSRLERNGLVIGCVANFQPLKDQLTLLRAVARLAPIMEDLRCILIGSGQMLSTCKEFVNEAHIQDIVEFRAEIDHLKLASFYRSLDLFVLPSRSEGFCCAYVEALACGTPIMACKGISVKDLLSPEQRDAFLINPGDDKELSEKILAFSRAKCRWAIDSQFDTNRIAEKFVAYLEEL